VEELSLYWRGRSSHGRQEKEGLTSRRRAHQIFAGREIPGLRGEKKKGEGTNQAKPLSSREGERANSEGKRRLSPAPMKKGRKSYPKQSSFQETARETDAGSLGVKGKRTHRGAGVRRILSLEKRGSLFLSPPWRKKE